MNMHISISKFGETEHAVSRVLELMLSTLGLNQDVLNYNRFPKYCRHKDGCKCITQSKDAVMEFARQFASNKRNCKALNDELKTANFNAKIEIIESMACTPES
jgi:hypothetical protein